MIQWLKNILPPKLNFGAGAFAGIMGSAGGVSTPTSTQWRVVITAALTTSGAASSTASIAELQLQLSGGTKPGYSSFSFSGSYSTGQPSNVNDGNNATFVLMTGLPTTYPSGEVFSYTYSSAQSISWVYMFFPNAQNAFPSTVYLDYYNGTSWVNYKNWTIPKQTANTSYTFI